MADLSHDEAIDALRTLPEDKQREVLGRLTPEGRTAIMAKLQDGSAPKADAPPTAPTPDLPDRMRAGLEAHTQDLKPTGGFLHDDVAAPIVHVANRVVRNLGGMALDLVAPPAEDLDLTPANLMKGAKALQEQLAAKEKDSKEHPVMSTIEAIGNQLPAVGLGPLIDTHPQGLGTQVRGYATSATPGGDITGDMLTGLILHKGGQVISGKTVGEPGTFKRIAEHQRVALREKFGGGTEFTETRGKKFSESEARVRAQNQKADERTLAARGAVDERNADLQSKDAIERAKVEQENRDKGQQHQEKTVAELKDQADKIQQAHEKRFAVHQENTAAAGAHKAVVEKTLQARTGAEQTVGLRQEAETALSTASQALEEKVGAAKVKAKVEDDKGWTDIRAKNSDAYTTSAEPVQIAAEAATAEADPATSALFKRILKHAPGDEDVAGFIPERGAPQDWEEYQARQEANPDLEEAPPAMDANGLTFSRLQRWRTYLTHKLYGAGRLEGGTYHAYKVMLKGIDSAMDDITKQTGTTKELQEARARHTRRMETFSDSPNVKQTVATKALAENAPAHVKAEAQAARVKMLSQYDPSISEAQQAVASAKEHLGKFQTEQRLRAGLKQPPDRPAEKPLPDVPKFDAEKVPDRPAEKAIPEPTPAVPYKEPEALDAHEPAPDLTAERKVELNKNLKKYGATGQWVWRLIAGSALKAGTGLLTGGAGGTGQFAADLLIGQGALHLVTNMLRADRALDWMARPTAEDIAAIDSLPPSDATKLRQAMTGLAVEDAKRGASAKISPKVANFLGPANVALITGAVVSAQPKTAGEAKKRVEAIRSETQGTQP